MVACDVVACDTVSCDAVVCDAVVCDAVLDMNNSPASTKKMKTSGQ